MTFSIQDAHDEPGLGRLLKTIQKPATAGRLGSPFAQSGPASVAISSVGKQAGEVDALVAQIEDPARRLSAQEGLRSLVGELGGTPGKLLDVSVTLRELHEGDSRAFEEFLTAANEAKEAGLDLEDVAATLVDIADLGVGSGLARSFAAEVAAIASAEGPADQRQEVFDSFVRATQDALGEERTKRVGALEDLFQRVAYETTLDDKGEELGAG